MSENLTFEQLPKAVTMLTREFSELKNLLSPLIGKQRQQCTEQPEQLLTVKGAAEILGLSIPTIYSKCSRREIPFMKRSKRLYFSSSELMEYLKEGRKKSTTDIEKEALAYLSDNKKGLK